MLTQGYVRQGSPAPAFTSNDPAGYDWYCGSCKSSMLISSALPGTVCDIPIRCNKCGSINASPPYPLGVPIPAQAVLVPLASGHIYRLNSTVILPSSVSVVSDYTVIRHNFEVGRISAGQSNIRQDEMDSKTLASSLRVMLDCMSNNKFSRLVRSEERSIISRSHMSDSHPFARAVAVLAARSDADYLGQEHFVYAREMVMCMNLLARWENHPLFDEVVRGIINEYHHTITMLICASHLSDAGNSIGIERTSKEKNTVDLYIYFGRGRKMPIEVKAPRDLQNNTDDRERMFIKTRLDGVIKKARRRKQIGKDRPGIIAVGYRARSSHVLKAVKLEVQRLLKNDGRKYTYLHGIIAVGIFLPPKSMRFTGNTLHCTIEAHVDFIDNHGSTYYKRNDMRVLRMDEK
jgi:hypothetical protein